MRNYSQVFAVGDIHGCNELLNVILNKIIEVSKNNVTSLVKQFKKYSIDIIEIGSTNGSNTVIINNSINQSIDDLRNAWENGLRDKL